MTIDDDILKIRLEGIASAQVRLRGAFFLVLLACSAILIGLWNVYLSWDAEMARQYQEAHLAEKFGQELVNAETVKNWVKGQWIGIPLLGIQISISDVSILGSLTLYVFTFYYFLCARRENHEIGTLIQDIVGGEKRVLFKVYYSIRSNAVFTRISDDYAISSIVKNGRVNDNNSFANFSYKLFYYLPYHFTGRDFRCLFCDVIQIPLEGLSQRHFFYR